MINVYAGGINYQPLTQFLKSTVLPGFTRSFLASSASFAVRADAYAVGLPIANCHLLIALCKRNFHAVMVGWGRGPVLVGQVIDLPGHEVGEKVNGILELGNNVDIADLRCAGVTSCQLQHYEICVLPSRCAGKICGNLCGNGESRGQGKGV